MNEYAFSKKTTWGELSDSDARDISKKLKEIQHLVSLAPSPFYKYIAFAAFVVVSICVGVALGEFWYIVLFSIFLLPLFKLRKPGEETEEEEVANKIAFLMAECIYTIEYPPESTIRDHPRILGVAPNGGLYSNFVRLFPAYRSLKLRFLMTT